MYQYYLNLMVKNPRNVRSQDIEEHFCCAWGVQGSLSLAWGEAFCFIDFKESINLHQIHFQLDCLIIPNSSLSSNT